MNVEIGAEAALFPEKKYIKGIFVAVQEKGFGRYRKKGGSGVKKTFAQALLRECIGKWGEEDCCSSTFEGSGLGSGVKKTAAQALLRGVYWEVG